jgi:hypothetical protein
MRRSEHTARASAKACFDTRLHNVVFGVIRIPMAIEMVHWEVADGIRPAFSAMHNVTSSPRGALCDGLLTGRTHAILPSPDSV